MDQKKLDQQSKYWEASFVSKPEMFGLEPSIAAVKALKSFQEQNIKNIVSAEPDIQIDYISICDPISLKEKFEVKGRTLIALAVKIGPTRLIDNCIVEG